MQQHLQQLISTALQTLQEEGVLPTDVELPLPLQIAIVRTHNPEHGDFSSNIALLLARSVQCKPRELAEQIVAKLAQSEHVQQVAVAGPGFINFFLTAVTSQRVIKDVLTGGAEYGRSLVGAGQRVHIDFVSANPTGPLHVGHGRGAAHGAAVANLLEAVGFSVHREYYVNDAGRQMHILAVSVWLRYLELCGVQVAFPARGYQGDYVKDIATHLREQVGDDFCRPADDVVVGLPVDVSEPGGGKGGKGAIYVDRLIERAQHLLGKEHYEVLLDCGLQVVQAGIQTDLEDFGVTYQAWFPESRLLEDGMLQRSMERLREAGYLYEKDGAEWFRAAQLGDEKDRVVKRSNGEHTYFAADIAYHLYKYDQGYDYIIDIFGADHHGYVARIRAFLQALACDLDKLKIVLVQFATLYRGKQRLAMSTRAGEFITLRALYTEVGVDAARFFYVMRKVEQHLDFDFELAKAHSNDNPVYYVQYAHARICSVFRQLAEKHYTWDHPAGLRQLHKLTSGYEKKLMKCLSRYPEVVGLSALHYAPHDMARYLQELANALHSYYNAQQFLVADSEIRNARLCLITAVRQVLVSGLALLGVSAPEVM